MQIKAETYEVITTHSNIVDGSTEAKGYVTIHLKSELQYYYYMTSDNKISCENVETLYLLYSFSAGNRSAGKTYTVYRDKPNKTNTQTLTEYKLDPNDSAVIGGSPEEKEADENGYLGICHYGTIILKFDQNNYQFTPSISWRTDITQKPMDVIRENRYSCPAQLCWVTYSARGYSANAYYFADGTHTMNCLMSETFSGKYRCGSINYLVKRINKSLAKQDSIEKTTEIKSLKRGNKKVL